MVMKVDWKNQIKHHILMLQYSCLLSVVQLFWSDSVYDSKAILMFSNHRERREHPVFTGQKQRLPFYF